MPLAAFLTRIALIIGAIAIGAAGCGFPHYEFPLNEQPDASFDGSTPPPPDAAPDGGPGPSACASSDDCAGATGGSICDLDAGRCVQCIPGMGNCPWGYYCDNQRKCSVGCGSNEDCAQPADAAPASTSTDPDAGPPRRLNCDVSGFCIGCMADSDCPPSTTCETQSRLCVPGKCTLDHRCADGSLCCDGVCVTGTKCPACPTGFWDCNGKTADGCEAQSNTVDNCGMCNQKCSYPNQQAWCNMGMCAPGPCIAPYDNCDDFAMNGCEANKDSDPNNCGTCHHVCQNPHGTTKCEAGVCKPTCEGTTLAICDPAAGCSVDLMTDAQNCGTCGHVCKGGNCINGNCECAETEPAWDVAGGLSCSGAWTCGPYSGTPEQACKCFCVNQRVTCRINISDGPPC